MEQNPEPPRSGRAAPTEGSDGDSPHSTLAVPGPLAPNGQSDNKDGVLALIERVALDPRLDVEKLERLLAMQERILERNDRLAFNAAKGRILDKLAGIKIVKNRSVLYEIEKGKPDRGMHEAFKYAPLEAIDRVLGPLLAAEQMELTYSDEPTTDGRIMIRGRLKHLPGGHYEDSFMAAPLDSTGGKNNVQAVGSTNSYLRRYVACNIFNIVVVGDDDDGSGGLITDEQRDEILDKIEKAAVTDFPKFLQYAKARPIDEAGSLEAAVATILACNFKRAVSALDDRIARRAKAIRHELTYE